ncbi:MAG: hypothetical protein B6I34_04105 [Anaerolineaceae bacterium 4572_32.1]|nr:MAG: hypothetical protein B6I34_04105 [Anaerolineaceae bacterium 4572_32.1]
MINLPPQLTPSELLCCEELPSFVAELLRNSRSQRKKGQLSAAMRRALDSIEASREPIANVSQAAALIHLADAHREMGRLGPTLTVCQQAYPIFQRQRSPCQRHNEAVTAYALGLTHQLLGNEMDALKWYQKAGQLFEQVKKDWAAVNAQGQTDICTRLQRWTETLGVYLTAVRARADANLATRIWLPIIPSGADGDEFAIAELEIEQYAIGNELQVNGKSFRLQQLKGSLPISLVLGARYDALEIPDGAREILNGGGGDYALVVWREKADKEGPGVLQTLTGPEFGEFERDAGGKINFVRTDATVIGGEDMGEVGYVTALLRPA